MASYELLGDEQWKQITDLIFISSKGRVKRLACTKEVFSYGKFHYAKIKESISMFNSSVLRRHSLSFKKEFKNAFLNYDNISQFIQRLPLVDQSLNHSFVKDFEDRYIICEDGSLYSIFGKYGLIHKMNPTVGDNGYLTCKLRRKGIKKDYRIHNIVADHFIPNPMKKPFVNHIDANKLNNNVNNLEWCTPSENVNHAANLRLFRYNLDHHASKYSNDIVAKCRELSKEGFSYSAISRITKVNRRTVNDYINKRYRAVLD